MPTCNRGVFSSRVPQELLAIIVWPRRWRGRWRWRRRWRSMMALTDSFGEKLRVRMCCRVPVTPLRLQGSLLDIGGHGAQPTREDGRKTGEGATTSGPRREAGVCGRWAVGRSGCSCPGLQATKYACPVYLPPHPGATSCRHDTRIHTQSSSIALQLYTIPVLQTCIKTSRRIFRGDSSFSAPSAF